MGNSEPAVRRSSKQGLGAFTQNADPAEKTAGKDRRLVNTQKSQSGGQKRSPRGGRERREAEGLVKNADGGREDGRDEENGAWRPGCRAEGEREKQSHVRKKEGREKPEPAAAEEKEPVAREGLKTQSRQRGDRAAEPPGKGKRGSGDSSRDRNGGRIQFSLEIRRQVIQGEWVCLERVE